MIKPKTRIEDCIADACDGQIFKEHPLFSNNPLAFQLFIYFDEVEVCNPIGHARGIHKLGQYTIELLLQVLYPPIYVLLTGLFYYTLGNLEPRFRSSLKSIQLIAVVTTKNLNEYGFEKVLRPFIKDMNMLSKVILYSILIVIVVLGKANAEKRTLFIISACKQKVSNK